MSETICVVGSINMDLVVRAPEMPRAGETILGASFATHPGGKGANQAVAASRLGADAHLVGAVGDDEWGKEIRGELRGEGVDIDYVKSLSGVATGVGVVTVLPDGDNAILVASGANLRVQPSHVEEAHKQIAEADALILQAELPLEANLRAVEIATAAETRIVFNAAPASELPKELLAKVDLLVVNLAEARALARCDGEEVGPGGLARRLGALGPNRVAVTVGADGAVLFDGSALHRESAAPVDAVDAVGAGDAFVAALTVALCDGTRASDALRFACAAGAVATTVEGALDSQPRRDAVDALIAASRQPVE